MIDEYSDIPEDVLDRLEQRRLKMERDKVSERQTLETGLACSDMIDETLKLSDKAIKEYDLEAKESLVNLASKTATLSVKLQQLHMMRSGLLPPISANKDTQEKWENQAINQYEAEREKRKQMRGLHS